MRDLISDVITCRVLIHDTGKIEACDKIMFENQRKRRYGTERPPSKRLFENTIHSLLRRAEARTPSFKTVI